MKYLSGYFQTLQNRVIESSESSFWDEAVLEWEIVDVVEDLSSSCFCICGHPKLRYLFTIRNIQNGNFLFPIGSECIKKFGRDDLSTETIIREQLFKLLHAVEDNKFIILSSDFFSRKLLRYLYEHEAFKPTEYNYGEPFNDYKFMVDMFNKRNRTENQEKKARAIILNSIKPYLQILLKNKIMNSKFEIN